MNEIILNIISNKKIINCLFILTFLFFIQIFTFNLLNKLTFIFFLYHLKLKINFTQKLNIIFKSYNTK